ncbi:TPA: retron St85 family RNA-directed DNA polymerase, partial [Legionella pneumophila]|nr:retron St85 family RNA-directed DNA polymerase [Legionella pneumophila]
YIIFSDINPHDELDEICTIINNYKPETINSNFSHNYFKILLVLDLINVLAISSIDEIKIHAEAVLKKFDKNYEINRKTVKEMLFVLKKLDLVVEINKINQSFYLSKYDDLFLDYNPHQYKLFNIKKDIINSFYQSDESNTSNYRKYQIFSKYYRYYKDQENNSTKKDIEKEVKWINKTLDYEHIDTDQVIQIGPMLYKKFKIKKKNKGYRTICQPTAELKQIQRNELKKLYKQFLIHDAAKAYKKNINGILENASEHLGNNFFYKYDFTDFFSSIKADNFIGFLKRNSFEDNKILRLIKLFFVFDKNNKSEIKKAYEILKSNRSDINAFPRWFKDNLSLSIGAPSSPFISNIIMLEFDSIVFDWAKKNQLVYTRYADDLTFSSKHSFESKLIQKLINDTIKNIDYLNLRLNISKIRHFNIKEHVSITGLSITPDNKVSIGKKRKKEINALIHQYKNNDNYSLSRQQILRIKGLLAFCKNVETDFFLNLQKKYGNKVIKDILSEK